MTISDILSNISDDVKKLNLALVEETKPKARKYLSMPKFYNGREYGSEWEAGVARDLDLELHAGQHVAVLPQVTIPLRDGTRMVVDFGLFEPDGTWGVVEAKSERTKTAIYRHKKKEFKALYPYVPFREIVKPSWVKK